ncbi:hypothetical protein [Cypionkella psychrotolerans]|uniref:hypothetical protein n=1 Tax=Cypionkella psychrotolerans TaxID=1678131 RepID=UPI0006B57A08|nr:hypothetical protein [Cypionkella psychrotolerans]
MITKSAKQRDIEIERLRAALLKVAKLVDADPVYLPLFERLEVEIALDQSMGDAITRARLIARQRAMV